MRDARNKLVPSIRLRRRIALMTLIAAVSPLVSGTTPVLGTEPNPYLNAKPPLPLETSLPLETPSAVETNPFCEPTLALPPTQRHAAAPRRDAVVLASGSDGPAIRLVPIGAAIGLHAIDKPMPVRDDRAAMTIEKPATAAVQSNPLIQSLHRPGVDDLETNRQIAVAGNLPSSSSKIVASSGSTPVTNAFADRTNAAKARSLQWQPPAPTNPSVSAPRQRATDWSSRL